MKLCSGFCRLSTLYFSVTVLPHTLNTLLVLVTMVVGASRAVFPAFCCTLQLLRLGLGLLLSRGLLSLGVPLLDGDDDGADVKDCYH